MSLKAALVIGGVSLLSHAASAATLLEYWDFNNVSSVYNSGTLGKFATANPGGGTSVNNGEIYNTATSSLSSNSQSFSGSPIFTNGSISFVNVTGTLNGGTTSTAGFGAFTDVSAQSGYKGTPAPNDPSTKQGSLGIFLAGTGSTANPVIVLSLTSTGYSNLTLDFDGRKAGNGGGSLSILWSYSLDGGLTYSTPVSQNVVGTAGVFAANSLSLDSSLSNQSSFLLKGELNFSSASSNGTSFAFDNLELNGTAVPEPGTVALVGLGGLVVVWRVTKLRRQAA